MVYRVCGVIACAILVLLFGFMCIVYIRMVGRSSKTPEFDKQDYVKKNRIRFGVNNKGTSMDCCKIFTVSTSGLGL